MSLDTIPLIILILILVGVLPVWPHSSSWNYGPTGIVGMIFAIVIVMTGHLETALMCVDVNIK